MLKWLAVELYITESVGRLKYFLSRLFFQSLYVDDIVKCLLFFLRIVFNPCNVGENRTVLRMQRMYCAIRNDLQIDTTFLTQNYSQHNTYLEHSVQT